VRGAAIDFWSELDADILRCLAEPPGEMTPAAMLAEAGKVRIRSVERIM